MFNSDNSDSAAVKYATFFCCFAEKNTKGSDTLKLQFCLEWEELSSDSHKGGPDKENRYPL